MQVLLVLLLIISAVSAQMMPGSTNSVIANGKGGLGRWQRNLEGMNGRSYYANGNEYGSYGYAPAYSPFGFFG